MAIVAFSFIVFAMLEPFDAKSLTGKNLMTGKAIAVRKITTTESNAKPT